jgi:molybdate transport system substrate-binding protein
MRRAAAVLATAALLLAAQPAAAKSKPSGEITVFAASSLTEAFGAIAKQFERRFPGVSVKFDFDSSSNLATQIEQGAPADVFASADDANLQETIRAGAVASPPVVFARNRLAIAVERRNPHDVRGLADLGKPGLVVVLCTDDVPCGKYAAQAFTKAGVTVTPASKEANAKATLSKVSLGEADAGVVYATDVQAAKGSVIGVEIPDRFNVLASYPAAAVKGSRNAAAAHAWVEFLRSATAQRTLRRFGFLPP